ncbi:hypothetical protein [Inquilinus limosus]|uniref:hypothetical protein n=1 Tax=Inquilinus limosus TaxID=171674 RepID=UPI0012698E65|nr:hypothetical protein [Inquilinus limosus]
MPSNETALILSAIEDLRQEGRVRDAKLDQMLGIRERVEALETEVGRHRWGGIVALLLVAAGLFGEPAKTALMKLLGLH